jgi:hypothetical protein
MVWSGETAPGNDEVRLKSMSVYAEKENHTGVYHSRKEICVELNFTTSKRQSSLCVGFDLLNAQGEVVLRSYQTDLSPEEWPELNQGNNRWRCVIPGGLLNAGRFSVCPRIGMHNLYWIVLLDSVIQFEVILDHGVSPFWNALDNRNRPGTIAPILQWEKIN